jgi:serine/threonine protein kinase
MTACPICNTDNPPAATVCRACGAALIGSPAGGYSTALPAGTQLKSGEYAVGKVLGQGGFGITYLGSDARARRPVAIKEFFPYGSARQGRAVQSAGVLPAADYASARQKFHDEAQVLLQFRHPGIVDVYATFEENNTAYMVMEYLRGRSLEQMLEERGLLPEGEAVDYIVRAGEALAVVHAANLLHRDLKPGNIMLTDDGPVVLIDFGTARTYVAGKTGRMTTMVTPGYAPLEQYGQKVRFGPFTDIYALGATLHHLLTGTMPADATDRVTGVVLRSPRELNPLVSVAVSDAVMWAMEIRVDRRPQTVQEFLAALGSSALGAAPRAENRGMAPAPPTPPAPPPLPAPRTAPAPRDDLAPRESEQSWYIPDEGPFDVMVRGDQLDWPLQCACCGEPSDTSYTAEYTGGDGPFGLFEETRSWNVPYCSQCLEHVHKALNAPGPSLGKAAVGTLATALLGPVGLLIGIGAAASTIADAARYSNEVRELLKATCVAVGPAVGYRGWDGDLQGFTFVSRPFTEAFVRANSDRIVPQ